MERVNHSSGGEATKKYVNETIDGVKVRGSRDITIL